MYQFPRNSDNEKKIEMYVNCIQYSEWTKIDDRCTVKITFEIAKLIHLIRVNSLQMQFFIGSYHLRTTTCCFDSTTASMQCMHCSNTNIYKYFFNSSTAPVNLYGIHTLFSESFLSLKEAANYQCTNADPHKQATNDSCIMIEAIENREFL